MSKPVVVITGSAVGIGRGLAVAYGKLGGLVAALDIDGEENQATKTLVERAGGQCLAYTCDIGDAAAVEQVFEQIRQNTERIDLLLNNAAVFADTTLLGGSYEQQSVAFDASMSSCSSGAFYCTAMSVSMLEKSDNANVINMLTNHVKPGHYLTGSMATGYDCAKFALWRLTENWAAELAPLGIRVNGLCFGATDTPMLRNFAPQIVDDAMSVDDIVTAVTRVVNQGSDGATGQSYEFGMSLTPRENLAAELDALN